MINPFKLQRHISFCGIYFLFSRGKLVYIGKSSRNALTRIMSHRFPFDSFALEYIPEKEIMKKEKELIRKYKPKHNRQSKQDHDGVTSAPIPLRHYNRIKMIAEKKGISATAYINDALNQHFKERKNG